MVSALLTTCLLLVTALVSCEAGSLVQQHKRSQGCRGKYTAAIATQLEDICEDCYNLYKVMLKF